MSETKFTKGPWSVWDCVAYEGGGEDLCIGAGEEWLANMDHRLTRCPQITEQGHFADECDICTIDSDAITAEQRANAQLIAAAPEMYAALKEWNKAFDDFVCDPNAYLDHFHDVLSNTASVLKKARGES